MVEGRKEDDFVSILEVFKSLPKEEQIKVYKAFEEAFCKEEKKDELSKGSSI